MDRAGAERTKHGRSAHLPRRHCGDGITNTELAILIVAPTIGRTCRRECARVPVPGRDGREAQSARDPRRRRARQCVSDAELTSSVFAPAIGVAIAVETAREL